MAAFKKIYTNHGDIKTPLFMPDATRAVVKSLGKDDLERIGVGPMVVNTYHLFLEPGMKMIRKMGGVHKFMNWDKPLLSDSGGYQVFSLIHKNPKAGHITDDGAVFQSPFNGFRHELTPEKSIQIQFDLGVDMMVVLDDCPPNDVKKSGTERAVERTIAWAKRCDREYGKQIKKRRISPSESPLLFCVIQGGVHKDLRKQCLEGLKEIRDWDGYGFGARHVDSQGAFLGVVLQYTAGLIPQDRLRFALGIGTPQDIVRCVEYGWDMFDCVIPTREARHGRLYKFHINPKVQIPKQFYLIVNIRNARYAADKKPIDSNCSCELCQNYSAGYLHHLFKIGDPLAVRLATIHNVTFYMELMKGLRRP